jgi:hypothetical protein
MRNNVVCLEHHSVIEQRTTSNCPLVKTGLSWIQDDSLKRPQINNYKSSKKLPIKTKLGDTVYFAKIKPDACLLGSHHICNWCNPTWYVGHKHSWRWGVVSACVSRREESNFNIFYNPTLSASTKVCINQVSFSSVNYSVISNNSFGTSFEWITLYLHRNMVTIFLIEQLHDCGAEVDSKLHVSFLLGLLFDSENGGCILPRNVGWFLFPRNVGWISSDYNVLYPRRQNSHSHCCKNLKYYSILFNIPYKLWE